MSTTFYLPSTGAAAASPAFDAEWEVTAVADRLACVRAKISSSMSSKTSSGTFGFGGGHFLTRQYVSSPIGAGQISGTVMGQIRCLEAVAGTQCCRSIVIKVVSGDGATLRGILLSHFPGSLVSEYATSLTNRYFPPAGTALAPVTAVEGDRIVIEVGTRTFVNGTANATHSFGDNSGSDLGNNETDTLPYNPFIQFSADIPGITTIQNISDGLTILDYYDLLFSKGVTDAAAIADQIETYKIQASSNAEALSILDELQELVIKLLSDGVSIAEQISTFVALADNTLPEYYPGLVTDIFLDSGTRKFGTRDIRI